MVCLAVRKVTMLFYHPITPLVWVNPIIPWVKKILSLSWVKKNPLTPLGQKNTLTFRLICSWSVADILQTEGYWAYLRVSSGGPTLRCSNPPKEIRNDAREPPFARSALWTRNLLICMHWGEPPSMHHIHARIVIFRNTLNTHTRQKRYERQSQEVRRQSR